MRQQIISFQKEKGYTSRKMAQILGIAYQTFRNKKSTNKFNDNDLKTLKNFKK